MVEVKEEGKKQALVNQNIIGVLVAVAVLWYFFGGGLDAQVANDMQDIHNKVASDAVEQYEIAKKKWN